MTLCDHSGLQSWAQKHLSVMGKVALSHCGATEANERERHKFTDAGIAGLNKYWSIKRANWGNYLCDQRYIVLQTYQEMETNERQHTQTLTCDSNVLLVVIGGYLNPSWRQTLAAMTDPSKLRRLSLLTWTPPWALPAAESWGLHCMVHWHPAKLTLQLLSFTHPSSETCYSIMTHAGTLWCMLPETL